MRNFQIIKSSTFGTTQCDFWQKDETEVFMTISQLSDALGYASKSGIENMISRNEYLKDIEFSCTHNMWVGNSEQVTRIFSEDGIYEVSMLSKTPKAQEFRLWVRKILKGLRKGELKNTVPSYMIDNPIKRAEIWIEEQKEKQQLLLVNKKKDQIIGELKPKADYVDSILRNKGLVSISQISKDYGMSAQEMNNLLNELKIQYKQGKQWLLYSKYHDKGYTHSNTINIRRSNGMPDVTMNTKWTQKGRLFIYNTLKCIGIVPMIEQETLQEA